MGFKDDLKRKKDGSYILKHKTKEGKVGDCIECGQNPKARDLLYRYNSEDMILVRNTPPVISKLGCEVSPHKPTKCFTKCNKSFIIISDYYYHTFLMLCNPIEKLQYIQTLILISLFVKVFSIST